jgi:hypothetical protein
MPKFKITEYIESAGIGDYHLCEDEKGCSHKIDLIVDGSLKWDESKISTNDFKKSLVGKEIYCDHVFPFLEIAMEVELLEEEKIIEKNADFPEDEEDIEPRDCADDYEDYKNEEVNQLKSK